MREVYNYKCSYICNIQTHPCTHIYLKIQFIYYNKKNNSGRLKKPRWNIGFLIF